MFGVVKSGCFVMTVLLEYFDHDGIVLHYQGQIQTFKKGGHNIWVISDSVVCEAHLHAKHAKLGGSGGMPPRKILKNSLSEIESGAFLGKNCHYNLSHYI